MKALLTLSTLIFLAISSQADVKRAGYVQAIACGHNTMIPSPGQIPGKRPNIDFVNRVCSVSIQGMIRKLPVYTFEVVSREQNTTYVYSVVNIRPVYTTMPIKPGTPMPNGRLVMAEMQIIGTVEKGQFNPIYFYRDPGTVSMVIGSTDYSALVSMTGNLPQFGNINSFHPVRVDKFEIVYNTMK